MGIPKIKSLFLFPLLFSSLVSFPLGAASGGGIVIGPGQAVQIATMDMPAGWYQLECDVIVDGDPIRVRPGDRFVMPWPRAAVRRGTVTIGKKVSAVALETLECLGDTTRVTFAADAKPTVALSVDGRKHPVLELGFDDETGRGEAIGYPVLRAQQRLAVELKGEPPIEITLP